MTNIAPKIQQNQETRQGLKPLFKLAQHEHGSFEITIQGPKAQKPKSLGIHVLFPTGSA